MRWEIYAAIKRLLFEYNLVPETREDEQRFYAELVKLLKL
jgi:hypothetical protein